MEKVGSMTGKRLLVASGKGGVGKTWLAITLSQALSLKGDRVLLFDGDLGMANVDIQLGMLPKKDISEVIQGKSRLMDVISNYSKGFDVISGRSGTGQFATLPENKQTTILKELQEVSESYGATVIDLAAGVDAMTQNMSSFGDLCLVVLNEEPTSMTDAYAFLKVISKKHPKIKPAVVVNMAENAERGEKIYEGFAKVCENYLGFKPPLAGVIRKDPQVRQSICKQTPLLAMNPSSFAAKDVEKLAGWVNHFERVAASH